MNELLTQLIQCNQWRFIFKLEIWNDKAQQFVDAAGKGDLIDVEGRVKTETWDDRTTGEKRHALVLSVEAWEVLAKPFQNQQPQQQAAPAQPAAPAWNSAPLGGDIDDSDAPF
jgi:single-stranded DNA-binding protein